VEEQVEVAHPVEQRLSDAPPGAEVLLHHGRMAWQVFAGLIFCVFRFTLALTARRPWFISVRIVLILV
jgi:hypothetical protein